MGASSATAQSTLPGFEFSSLMSSGIAFSFASATDGLSNTILLGETVGEITGGERNAVQPWCVGGLARGRGKSNWADTTEDFLGTSKEANVFGFGSMHSGLTNVAFADGSVHSIKQTIDRTTFFGLCGCSDGTVSK
jgi:prepilin-type processing-associated H-X9-DG protein